MEKQTFSLLLCVRYTVVFKPNELLCSVQMNLIFFLNTLHIRYESNESRFSVFIRFNSTQTIQYTYGSVDEQRKTSFQQKKKIATAADNWRHNTKKNGYRINVNK